MPAREEARRPETNRARVVTAAALSLVALSLVATACDPRGRKASASVTSASAPEPAVDLPLPTFALTDQRGQAFTSESMRGNVHVVDFVFTSCPSICPALTQKMAGLVDRLSDEPRVRFLSISVDPENDTPEKMTAFLAKYGKDSPRWSFVTGDEKVIDHTVIDGFKIRLERDQRGTLAHGEHFVVVDKDLRIRGYFDASPERLDALVNRARELAAR